LFLSIKVHRLEKYKPILAHFNTKFIKIQEIVIFL
jgi:hypothetical protein